ncbi:hypothetical protein CP533_1823 [Ophiocordyceps camponoti-saundersi (nom. inval.)]|nr:hypothetical protein CP533_1823 [Ophiocordyceps camponoti-saundersi (nom. inval.)]
MKPFPLLGLSIGTDICQITRIRRILTKTYGKRFVDRILTPEEKGTTEARLRLGRGDVAEQAVFLAGRFAAKEAVFKAFSRERRLTWHDVSVWKVDGRPVGLVRPLRGGNEGIKEGEREVEKGGGDEGEEEVLVSISHDGDYATAFCIACIR